MATSEDGEEQLLVEGTSGDDPKVIEGATSRKGDDADGNAHDDGKIRINPEVLRGVSPLPDLDSIEVILIQPTPGWARWSEGLLIHVVGSGVVAGLAFFAGLLFADATNKAEGAAKQPVGCTTATVSAPQVKAE
jgi:hypothetical protein